MPSTGGSFPLRQSWLGRRLALTFAYPFFRGARLGHFAFVPLRLAPELTLFPSSLAHLDSRNPRQILYPRTVSSFVGLVRLKNDLALSLRSKAALYSWQIIKGLPILPSA